MNNWLFIVSLDTQKTSLQYNIGYFSTNSLHTYHIFFDLSGLFYILLYSEHALPHMQQP